jgi:hypothetical protein
VVVFVRTVGVAYTPAGRIEIDIISIETVSLRQDGNSKPYERNYLGFLIELNLGNNLEQLDKTRSIPVLVHKLSMNCQYQFYNSIIHSIFLNLWLLEYPFICQILLIGGYLNVKLTEQKLLPRQLGVKTNKA